MLTIPFQTLRYIDAFLLFSGSWLLYKLVQSTRRHAITTKLCGPPASSWLFGVSTDIFFGDSGDLYEQWANEYGPVYQIPGPLGDRYTVLTDPRAIAHFYSKETYTYVNSTFSKQMIDNFLGKGLLWAEGDDHRRQRRTLSPAFTNAAIRSLTPVFFDSAYKVKAAWDPIIGSSVPEEAIIDVQKWMNCVSLDSIGLAAFGHDFGALYGRHSNIEEIFSAFSTRPPAGAIILTILLGPAIPFLSKLPSKRAKLVSEMRKITQQVSETLLETSRKEKEFIDATDTSRSIIGSLLKAEASDSALNLTKEEVLAQMRVLLLAGYETTSISLTWALIELSLHPEKQDKLRNELAEFANDDPSYDQLMNSLPYLDAVAREVIRLHPPVEETKRIAACDDIVPLSNPIVTARGERVNNITLARNSQVVIPIRGVNRSEDIWGPDAKEFKPDRWLNNESGLTEKAKEVHGYHHILSFIDGPRTCLGRPFAVAEFKAVLSVLIRNYVFNLRDGPDTKIDMVTSLLPRPKVAGEEGYAMPMRVRRFEH